MRDKNSLCFHDFVLKRPDNPGFSGLAATMKTDVFHVPVFRRAVRILRFFSTCKWAVKMPGGDVQRRPLFPNYQREAGRARLLLFFFLKITIELTRRYRYVFSHERTYAAILGYGRVLFHIIRNRGSETERHPRALIRVPVGLRIRTIIFRAAHSINNIILYGGSVGEKNKKRSTPVRPLGGDVYRYAIGY